MRISTVIAAAAVLLSTATAPAAQGVDEIMAVIEGASASLRVGERTLAVGSEVSVGDLVTTDAGGEAQILFSDGTRMVVGPNSSLMIDEFLFHPNGAENAPANRFDVNALSGAFRFISGDGGDRGYSIRTPSARISLGGTAFDFIVTRDGTKLVLLEGEATLCSESDESGEDDDCATVVTPCALLQTEPGEDVEEITLENGRVQQTREHFPYVTSDSSLLEDFRIVGHGCTDDPGGLSKFALNRAGIRVPVGFALGGIIICILVCSHGNGGPPIDTNNGTN